MADDLTIEEFRALRGLHRDIDARWVESAGRMLVEGHDTPALRVLAGEVAPFNPFEMGALVDRVLEETGVGRYESREAAAAGYAVVCARKLLAGAVPIEEALEELSRLAAELDYPSYLHDFYLLHHARDALRYDPVQMYWPSGDRDNIDDIVRQRCASWLLEHDSS